jgi:formyl-CoA transferase
LSVKPAHEWSVLFNRNGVPAGEVLSIPEILDHPQVAERELVKRFSQMPLASIATSPSSALVSS